MKTRTENKHNFSVSLDVDNEGCPTYSIESSVGNQKGKSQDELLNSFKKIQTQFADQMPRSGLAGFFEDRNFSLHVRHKKHGSNRVGYTLEQATRSELLNHIKDVCDNYINEFHMMQRNCVSSPGTK